MPQRHIIATVFKWYCEQYLVARITYAVMGIVAATAVISWVTH